MNVSTKIMNGSDANRFGKNRHPLIDLLVRLVREKPLGLVGGIIVILLLFTGIFADTLAPYDINKIHLRHRLSPPSKQFLMGTDNLGRDLLSRIVYGARISVIVGLSAAGLDTLIAMVIGIISGYIGGKTDITIQRFVDAWMCLPGLVIILTIMAVLGPGLVQVIFVIGFSSGIRSSRVVRGATIGIKEHTYVYAAKSIGCSTWRILVRHILPNIMAPIIVLFTVSVGIAILMEASLSFLGFGIPPPAPAWGSMLSGAGREYMQKAPLMAIWPGLALAAVVFGINVLGDAMRDLLDPRLRGGIGRYSLTKTEKKSKRNSHKDR
jgi:peptide/nickel transport system permease protein